MKGFWWGFGVCRQLQNSLQNTVKDQLLGVSVRALPGLTELNWTEPQQDAALILESSESPSQRPTCSSTSSHCLQKLHQLSLSCGCPHYGGERHPQPFYFPKRYQVSSTVKVATPNNKSSFFLWPHSCHCQLLTSKAAVTCFCKFPFPLTFYIILFKVIE